jgi:hypothetical protein
VTALWSRTSQRALLCLVVSGLMFAVVYATLRAAAHDISIDDGSM